MGDVKLPAGSRRATDGEVAHLAEAHRWRWPPESTLSPWLSEPGLKILSFPGRELVMTQAEWEALRDSIKAGHWDGF